MRLPIPLSVRVSLGPLVLGFILGQPFSLQNAWAADYNTTAGYGWYAPPDVHWLTTYLSSGPNVLQRSILYSDWGRKATFEFDLPNGAYNVTVSVGWQGRTYANHKVDIEGVSFVNVEATTPANPYLVRTKPVYISDNKLTMAIGDGSEYYHAQLLNYLTIEAVNSVPAAVTNLRVSEASTGSGSLTATLAWTPPGDAITTTLRYSAAPITEAAWNSATQLTGVLPGGQNTYNATLPYTSGSVYFALKTQDADGGWSGLSNNAFWPHFDVYLPSVRR